MVLLPGAALAAPAHAGFSDFGIDSASASLSTAQAGAHPDFTTVINIKTDPASPPDGDGDQAPWARTRDILVDLPPGLSGNPTALPRCTAVQFAIQDEGGCPNASQVGLARVRTWGIVLEFTEPIYNLQAPEGTVARLGFNVLGVPTVIDIEARPERDYALSASVEGIFTAAPLVSATTTLWGVPADPSHDTERPTPREGDAGQLPSPPRPPGVAAAAFMTNPTSCGGPLEVGFSADSYQDPEHFSTTSVPLAAITSCGRLDFTPGISLQPTTRRADWASGMDVQLTLPQDTITDPGGLTEAHLKKTVVTLPEGMALNPAAADGLAGCTTAQIGLVSKDPIRFNDADPACPDASKVGTAVIDTPLLPNPIPGALYVADQHDNAFDTLLSGYLVAKGQGVLLKIPGRFDADPGTGRITATFDDNPQQPFSAVDLHFKGGDRGVVATPPGCGRFGVHSVFTSWAAPSEEVTRDGAFVFDQGCGAAAQFEPAFTAGAETPVAGASSPFTTTMSREPATQHFQDVEVTLPAGLLAAIKGIPQCPEDQANAGSCDSASRIGHVISSAGSGPSPLWIPQAGKADTAVFLAGPYKGAPFSLSVLVPAQAGPFDLGNVIDRVALYVDPTDAHVRAVADRLPHILMGIPLNVRTISLALDRGGFTRNPTSCSPMAITGTFGSLEGTSTDVSSRFQVGDCAGLPYAPKIAIALTDKTQTKDGQHPGIDATATQAPGEAGIKQVKVALPLALALDPDNAQALCEYEDGQRLDCPDTSIVGRAEATTPLLNEPLTGPVYFVKNIRFNAKGQPIRTLPTLLVKLTGENGLKLNLRASSSVDSTDRLVSTFANVPDAPVASFRLTLDGGKHGIIVVTHDQDVCRKLGTAQAQTDSQAGRTHDFQIKLKTPCPPAARLGKAKVGKHGIVHLPVTVPGPGTLKAGGGKSGLRLLTKRTTKAGKLTLVLKPTTATLKQLARAKRKRKLSVKIPVSFVMAGAKDADKRSSAAVGLRR